MHGDTPSETESASDVALSLDLTATTPSLIDALASVEQYVVRRNLDGEMAIRLCIVIEELVTNAIKYGYGREGNFPVRLRLHAGPPLELVYEDAAPAFDPLAWYERWLAGGHDPEAIGQRGIPMILGLADQAGYQALSQGNRLTLTFRP
jgi:serine/threonine-protein kinase RsbW